MPVSCLVPLVLLLQTSLSLQQLESTTDYEAVNEQNQHKNELIEMEIIRLEVEPEFGNLVELSWGSRPIRALNWTFDVYYGLTIDEALLDGPQITTNDLSTTIANLTHCTQYAFAVIKTQSDHFLSDQLQNTRLLTTLIDPTAPPTNLQLDYVPNPTPCISIKFSASCGAIYRPLGYTITVSQTAPSRLMLLSVPKTTTFDIRHTLTVDYGKEYAVKVSTDAFGANATDPMTFQVPLFLQPFKLNVTSNLEEGAFVLYWREPFVPHFIGDYHYEVFVYPRRELEGDLQLFKVKRPVLVFKGNDTQYSFVVGLRSDDGAFKGYLTKPIWKHFDSESVVLDV